MNFGLRTLLLMLAVIVFVLAVFSNGDDYTNLIAWGLAAVAFSFLLGDIGWDRRYGGGRR